MENLVKLDFRRCLSKAEIDCNKFFLKNLQTVFKNINIVDNFRCVVYNKKHESDDHEPFLISQNQNLFYGEGGYIIFIVYIYFVNGDTAKLSFDIWYDWIYETYMCGYTRDLFKVHVEIYDGDKKKIIEKSFAALLKPMKIYDFL